MSLTTRQGSWRRVALEGLTIVGSILLAFGIDAWWDDQQDLAEESRYLAGLDAEFTENLEILTTVIARHQQFAELFDRLESMTDEEVLAIPADEVDSYDRAIGQWMTFEARGGTITSLLTSGRLTVLQDAELRNALVEWLRLLDDASEEVGFLTRTCEKLVLRQSQLMNVAAGRLLRPDQLLVMKHDEAIMGLARAKQFFARVYLNELRRQQRHAESILVAVRSNLRRV